MVTNAVLALAMTAFVPLHAQAQTTLERAKAEGSIRIGFTNETPFGFVTPDGKLTGESPEIARAVLAKMGISKIEGVVTEFGSLIPGLKAGRFDIIAAGMFIKPSRCAEINFSEPSYGVGQAFLVKEGNPDGVKDYLTIKNDSRLKLAIMTGGAEVGYVKAVGIDPSQLVMLPDQASLLAAVQSGRANAAALPEFSIASMAKKAKGVEATKPFDEVGGISVKGVGGFGFRKEDTDLVEAFNTQMKLFIGSPEHLALVEPFGFSKAYLPDKTVAQACSDK
jgi:polar amino acid transport system substrate-binding protein